ncbi:MULTISPECIES: hypothetical protein [Bradyrhizobium]|uniref:Uncharacterized protein n=2 Tax=Bradyrhizobium TaxID=374 RepID=A0A7Y4GXN7_9BRAD|nr:MULTISPECIES: hypothetical protein [Bradyrhizobium]NOJ43865.1 hypothetical protein [Bradyrhizobium australiense]NOJ50180.1 hypothetical protein [Bradyrhizobium archetypum]
MEIAVDATALDDAPAPLGADQFAGQLPVSGDPEALEPFSPRELRGPLNDEPAPFGVDQLVDNLQVPADPDALIFKAKQMPLREIRRLLDDEHASSPADQPARRLPNDY